MHNSFGKYKKSETKHYPTCNSRATTSFFNLTLPTNPVTDIFQGIQAGTSRDIADGYFLFLAPLPRGTYLIDFKVVDHITGPESPAQTREGQYTVVVK
jgi:hypothetical protein